MSDGIWTNGLPDEQEFSQPFSSPRTVVVTFPSTDPNTTYEVKSAQCAVSSGDISGDNLSKILSSSYSISTSKTSCTYNLQSNYNSSKSAYYDFSGCYNLSLKYLIGTNEFIVSNFDDIPSDYRCVTSYTAPVNGKRTVTFSMSVTYDKIVSTEPEDGASTTSSESSEETIETITENQSFSFVVFYTWDSGKNKLKALVDDRR